MQKNFLALLVTAFILTGIVLPIRAIESDAITNLTNTATAAHFQQNSHKELRHLAPTTNTMLYEPPYSYMLLSDTKQIYLPDALLLVSPLNPLAPEYIPKELTAVSGFVRANGGVMLRKDAAHALNSMIDALKSSGIKDIFVNSGYRNFERQSELYKAKVNYYRNLGAENIEQAQAQAARWVLPPGESEHQTGLALDFSTDSQNRDLTEAFAKTAAGKWLEEHCVEYGFIVRYTAEKESWTKVASEPWHFRYVGTDHAYYMQQHDLCLEEYHALLREKTRLLFENAAGEERAVYYNAGDSLVNLPGIQLAISLARYGSEDSIITKEPLPQSLFDTVGHWAEPYIMRLRWMEVVSGYPNGGFNPNNGVSRAEFITAFSRLPISLFTAASSQKASSETLSSALTLPYEDVSPEKYYYKPLLLCYNASLLQVLDNKGTKAVLFEANRPLLRFEAALILAQVFQDNSFLAPDTPSYRDVPATPKQLYNSVELLTSHGVLSGGGDGLFHPDRIVSRAEMCTMLCFLLDALVTGE
ncbi:MAG: D-alanyl-D-alanine carboxypeptidase family protein [Firmicutes bacterium]|nr:D-alanyl-D-alanine carboxypeptidase family protein [Bacillota bacterium]